MSPLNLKKKARDLKRVRALLEKMPNARKFEPEVLVELLREERELTAELEGFDLGPRPIQLLWDGALGHSIWQVGEQAYTTTATLRKEDPSGWSIELSRPDNLEGVFTLLRKPSRLCFFMLADTPEEAKVKANYGLWVLWARTVRGKQWSRGKGIFVEEPK